MCQSMNQQDTGAKCLTIKKDFKTGINLPVKKLWKS